MIYYSCANASVHRHVLNFIFEACSTEAVMCEYEGGRGGRGGGGRMPAGGYGGMAGGYGGGGYGGGYGASSGGYGKHLLLCLCVSTARQRQHVIVL